MLTAAGAEKLGISERMTRTRESISSLVLGGWEIEQPSPEYFLPPVQVPISEFFFASFFFKSGLRFPDGTLKSLKVYDPHHGREFWPSSSYSKADIWSFGYEECSIPWLLVLPSRRVVRKRSVLDQIPILWKAKMFRGEGGNGLTLRTSLVFLFELLISSLLSRGMGLVSFFFFFLYFFV